jgi:hypothetical protein
MLVLRLSVCPIYGSVCRYVLHATIMTSCVIAIARQNTCSQWITLACASRDGGLIVPNCLVHIRVPYYVIQDTDICILTNT